MFELSAYCPCVKCCGKSDGMTSIGRIATANRTIAVDTDIIPLGSTVRINGINYVAEDVGGAIQGKKIDVYFDTHQEAINFGIKEYEVFIKE